MGPAIQQRRQEPGDIPAARGGREVWQVEQDRDATPRPCGTTAPLSLGRAARTRPARHDTDVECGQHAALATLT